MPVTIDRLDIGIYVQYARRMQLVEQIQKQYHLKEAGSVPAQALIIDVYPKLSELDLLLGVGTTLAPWALFLPPEEFSHQRKIPFAFHRVLPIFGESDAEAKEEKQLDAIACKTKEEEQERNILKQCLKKIRDLNSMMRYIGGRIGQFLQG